jgi:hypothetical protein
VEEWLPQMMTFLTVLTGTLRRCAICASAAKDTRRPHLTETDRGQTQVELGRHSEPPLVKY